MTSIEADRILVFPGFSYTSMIQGQVHHRIESFDLALNEQPVLVGLLYWGHVYTNDRHCQIVQGSSKKQSKKYVEFCIKIIGWFAFK